MGKSISEETRRTKTITCRGNKEEVSFINKKKEKYGTTIRELILLGIKTLEEQSE